MSPDHQKWGYIFYFSGLEIFLYITPLIILNILKLERYNKSGYLGISVALTITSGIYFLLSILWISRSIENYFPSFGTYALLISLPLNLISIYYDKKHKKFN
ncbi:hypothetical protein GCM10008083_32960 [Ulvibacter litoralis]|nr:hypothetical protein GCM10008083_32960 [Ulvibacter litoralis]